MKLEPRYHERDFFKNFWQKGTGKYMVDWTGAQLSFEKFDHFSKLFYEVDEIGDAAAKEIFFSMPFEKAMKQIDVYAATKISTDENISDGLKEMFSQMQQVPEWLDEKMLVTASEFSRRSGLSALVVLRDFTLMGGYDYAYLNKPLVFTGALKKGAVKRLRDTLHFWTTVTRKDAMKVHADGYRFCASVRLIHSFSRLMILEKVKEWDTKNWGLPINSWDMIATYIGFSLTFLLGLKKLGIKISKYEEDSLFHLWKYIGFLIGIPIDYIPNNAKEATEYFYLWSSIQPCADEDSVLLAKALLDENLISPVYDDMRRRKQLKYLHTCSIWHLLDREVNERLQIPKVRAAGLFPAFLIARNKLFYSFASKERQILKGDLAQREVLRLYLEKA